MDAPPHPLRKIIHVDMDCFYAAIEMRDNPALRSHCLAVGGAPGKRGVISTCNYPARRYGVRSAMASSHALILCPDLVIVPPQMEKYAAEAQRIRAIFRRYTERIEPLSFDEAYLDVTGSPLFQGSATRIADDIRRAIQSELQLTASAGVAPNKFLAKIASDWRKPNGLFVLRPDDVDAFVLQLPVEKLHGVGKVTAARLHELGVRNCAELRALGLPQLLERFGRFGQQLFLLARGIDEREVVIERVRKSLSVETTFDEDKADLNACQAVFPAIYEEFVQRQEQQKSTAPIHKLFIKLKFADFSQTTMECLASAPTLARAQALLQEAYQRYDLPVRLIGVGVRYREDVELGRERQLELPLA